MSDHEIRFVVPGEELCVLDGYCVANGKGRTDVLRGLLRKWSEKKRHEAVSICRAAGINPTAPDTSRK